MSLLQGCLIFSIIGGFLTTSVNSQLLTVFPEDSANKTCSLSDGRGGLCVYGYLCKNDLVNIEGDGIIDIRFADECEDYMLKCCSIETPCENDKGTCVATNRCKADLNNPRYRPFQDSDECEWGGYSCCPKDKIGTVDSEETECDDDSICVPDAQCVVNPDGANLLEARASVCSGQETCCPRNHIRKTTSNLCDEIGGKCVRQGQCRSVYNVNIRTQLCDEHGFECCMDSSDTTNTSLSCMDGSGTCTAQSECKDIVYSDRNNECDGLICCAKSVDATTSTTVTSSTTLKPTNPGKSCVAGSGICIPRKECKGTVYRDKNKECEGLACCAMLPPTTISTTTSRTRTDKDCFNNRGKCMLRSNCKGIVYKDRHNECDGLVCCESKQTTDSSTPRTIMTSTTTVKPVPTCSSMKGTCVAGEKCQRRSTFSASDCNGGTVCCTEVIEDIRDCGYRNEHGIKFNTINRNDGESQYGEFPWVVAIMAEVSSKSKFSCGGSLIHPAAVLTSAECVKSYRRTPDQLIVRAGEWDMGSKLEPFPYQERRVMKIISHPGFQPNTLANNVALVFVDDEFVLGATVNTICLPPQNFNIDNGEVVATGWGTTPTDRTRYQQILKSINLPYINKQDCERLLRTATSTRNFKLHPSFICAGGERGVDTCSGDAGSPVIHEVPDDPEFRYHVIGMVSWGVGCGRAGIPAVYTDVGLFRNWIDTNMEHDNLDTRFYRYQFSNS